jgi:hypothetical protein
MPEVYQDMVNQNQPTNDTRAKEPQVDPNKSTQQQPDPNSPAEPKQDNKPSVEDIVSRASSVELGDDKPKGGDQPQGDILSDAGFDRNKWNAMLEQLPPEQRTQLESAYKSLQTGADKKFQKAAEMLRQAQASVEQPWTIERIQQLTQDPEFVQAAQQYAQASQSNYNPQSSGLSEEEWSNLSESEKAKFQELTQNQLALQSKLDSIILSQQDEQLKQRYRNYDANVVNDLRQQLLKGKVQATNEHLWKVVDYESAIQRAYKLGLQDRQLDMEPKIDATPVGGSGAQITPSGDAPVKAAGENTVCFFKRLADYNKKRLQQAQGKQQ